MQGALLVLEAVDVPAMDVFERSVDQAPREALVVGAVRLDFVFELDEVLQATVCGLHAVVLRHLFLVGGGHVVGHSVLHVDLDLMLYDVLLSEWSDLSRWMLKSRNVWVTVLDIVAVGEEGTIKGLHSLEVNSRATLGDVLHRV